MKGAGKTARTILFFLFLFLLRLPLVGAARWAHVVCKRRRLAVNAHRKRAPLQRLLGAAAAYL